MLQAFINKNTAILNNTINIHENFSSLRINFSSISKAVALELITSLSCIPLRDKFELFMSIDGNETTTTINNIKSLQTHLSSAEEDDTIEATLEIFKNFENSELSVYFIDYFSEWLVASGVKTTLELFNTNFSNFLIFRVFDKIKSFGTQSIYFESYENSINQNAFSPPMAEYRETRLKSCTENTNYSDLNSKLIPEDFYLLNKPKNPHLSQLFDEVCAFLCLRYLSNTIYFHDSNKFSWKINGYKTVDSGATEFQAMLGELDLLYKIYNWTYTDGNCSDKIGLIRNIFSIHLDDKQKVLIDASAWEAIQSNYQIYQRKNIQSYLELKNKIGDTLIESITKTYTLSDELVDSFKINIGAIATFVISIVIVSGIKDLDPVKAFSVPYTAILILMCLLSAAWSLALKDNLEKRFKNYTDRLKSALKVNYKDFLIPKELDDLVNPITDESKKYFDTQLKLFTRYWWAFLFVICIIFIIGTIYFSKVNHNSDANPIKNDTHLNINVSLSDDSTLFLLAHPKSLSNKSLSKS